MNSLSHWPSPPAKRPNSSAITLPDRLEMNAFTESFLFLSGSSSSSLAVFVDRLVDSATSDSDRDDIIERVLRLGSVLLEAGKRSERKRDCFHNSIVWPLHPELTINVFSMLDTQSVCYAAATCTFFRKCALDSLCYASIDLLTAVPKVNNLVVSTIIQRAGKALRHVELRKTLESVIHHCQLIERLYFESSRTGRDDSLKITPTCIDLVRSCPHITSLALRGFKLQDYKVLALVKAAVERFLNAVLAGNFKFLRHLDISNLEGLANEDDWSNRCYSQSFIPMDQLREVRPNLCLLAKFRSYIDVDSDGDLSTPSQISTTSDSSSFMSTSESSYNSDQGSGDERHFSL